MSRLPEAMFTQLLTHWVGLESLSLWGELFFLHLWLLVPQGPLSSGLGGDLAVRWCVGMNETTVWWGCGITRLFTGRWKNNKDCLWELLVPEGGGGNVTGHEKENGCQPLHAYHLQSTFISPSVDLGPFGLPSRRKRFRRIRSLRISWPLVFTVTQGPRPQRPNLNPVEIPYSVMIRSEHLKAIYMHLECGTKWGRGYAWPGEGQRGPIKSSCKGL